MVLRERDFFSVKAEDMQTQIWTGELEGFSKMQEIMYVIRTSHGNLCESKRNTS